MNIGQFSGGVVTDLFESGIKINLTRELKSTFFKPEKLKEIFAKYPHVSRRVGTLPPELAKKIGNGSKLEKFDEALTDFARNFTKKGYGKIPTEEEVSSLSTALTQLLGEAVTVTPIGGGKIGYGYKIATKEKDMFKTLGLDYKPQLEKLIAQQSGIFVPQETIEKIAQSYGVSVQEIEIIRKAQYNIFNSKYGNNLIHKKCVF